MDRIKSASSEEIMKQITLACEEVATWPSWKCNPEVIEGAKRYLEKQKLCKSPA